MSLFSRIADTIRDFFTGGDSAPDPIGDAVEQVTDNVVEITSDDEPRTYDSFDYDSFSEAAEDLGISSADVRISSDGVDITYHTDDGPIVEHFPRISDFFDDRYDELEAEGIEFDIEDDYEANAA